MMRATQIETKRPILPEAPFGAVLVVDDEVSVRRFIDRVLTSRGRTVFHAKDGTDALNLLKKETSIDVVISDINMPGIDGLEFVRRAKANSGRSPEFIMLTGRGSREYILSALRLGVSDFLEKPVELIEVIEAVEKATSKIQEKRAKEQEGVLKGIEVSELLNQLEYTHTDTLRRIAAMVKYKDIETANHCVRIAVYARQLTELMGWPDRRQKELELAAPLHDIGMISVPDSILAKPGDLNEQEWKTTQHHTRAGYRMLIGSTHIVMTMAADIALYHHERWDGTGYPYALSGSDIPIEARVVAICDVYDVLRSNRPYKKSFTHHETVALMLKGDGRTSPEHFDPELLELFRNHHHLFEQIHRHNPEAPLSNPHSRSTDGVNL